MAESRPLSAPQPKGATGVVVFADGRTIWGQGFGAEGEAVGELCFNTAMTGYQEVMTDPSYAKQVIAFTFPHIGNVGANDEDVEAGEAHALGCLVREVVTEPSNYRANQGFADWMRKWGRIGIAGVDTRALTRLVRTEGPPTIAIAHRADGQFDLDALRKMAAEWPGLEGMDLAKEVSRLQVERWSGGKWAWEQGYELGGDDEKRPHVVAVDYGNKRNIFRNLVEAGARVPRSRPSDGAVELSRDAGFRRLDEEMGADRHCRRRHARADPAGARGRAADGRDRLPGGRAVRSRQAAAHGGGMAGPRRHGPGEGGQPAPGRALDRRQMGVGAGV